MSSFILYKNADEFFRLPELIENLCLSLDNNDILKLMQTNRTIYNAAAPCLWCNVDLNDDYRVELLYTNNNYNYNYKQSNIDPKRQDSDGSKPLVQTFAQLTYRTRSLKAGYAFMSYYLEGLHDVLDTEAEKNAPTRQNWISELRANLFSKPIPLITRLHRLDVSLQRAAQITSRMSFFVDLKKAPPLIPRLFRFMTCNVNTLTDVHLRDVPFPTDVDIRHLCRTISRLKHLTHLTIDIPPDNKTIRQKLASSVVPTIFSCCPPSLVSFKLTATVRDYGEHRDPIFFLTPVKTDSDFEEGPMSPRQGPLPNLKILKLPQHETGYRANLLCDVLVHCPALEEWDVPFLCENTDVAMLVSFLQHTKKPETQMSHLSALRHLHYTHPGADGKGETAAAIMEMIPKNELQSLTFHGYEDTIPDAPNTLSFISCLMMHSTSLVSIKLQDMDRIQSNTIKDILTNCEALETLVLTCSETMLSRLTLDDAIICAWKCVNLKELRMAVDLRRGYTKANENLEKFYKQLGVLKNLEILDLMSACRQTNNTSAHYSNTVMTCMLSLGGPGGRLGFLNSLAGLENLRVLLGSFFLRNQEMRDMLGEDEVDWILKNWPHLEMIEFFSSRDRMHASYPHIEALKRQRPNLQLFRKEKQ